MAAVACGRAGGEPPAAAPPATESSGAARRPASPSVVFVNAAGDERRVAVELAVTPAERRRGLMFRERLEPGHGMLFLFPREEVQSFWMKNTLIPLDMIFIRSDMTVAGVVERAEPRSLESRAVPTPSQYVLEVPGGWARANGIGPGAPVRFEGVPPPPPR
ncbi:MAG: DUF192 domain-containing protein [Deltaproteobacteria bacterium]|nr:MAG: DUF192 domain-containing protein [Deltaproteobacteria bacterium]